VKDGFNSEINSIPGLVWTALPDGDINFVDRYWYKYTGIDVDTACGAGWLAAIHPDDLFGFLERWRFIEVSQPLSGIIPNANAGLRMLSAESPNVDGAIETVRRTLRDANRASAVISKLRALFSHDNGTVEPVNLNEATREVIALLLSELQRNRVILRSELSDDLPSIIGDRIQLQQVILNLLLNASETMGNIDVRPRQLVIKTEWDDEQSGSLSVRDAGIGIDPQNIDQLFDAFYTTNNGGMGMGLSVSRSIIESHQGRLWASLNDGSGTTFSFSMPRAIEVSGEQGKLDSTKESSLNSILNVKRVYEEKTLTCHCN
jgi:nitrogen-specific signal transduction histidine kinase